MKPALTELRNTDTINIDLMDSAQIVSLINQEDMKVALAVQKVLPDVAKAVDYIAEAFAKGGRLAYFGAGTSGRIGILDASECVPTFGAAPEMVQALHPQIDPVLQGVGLQDLLVYGELPVRDDVPPRIGHQAETF